MLKCLASCLWWLVGYPLRLSRADHARRRTCRSKWYLQPCRGPDPGDTHQSRLIHTRLPSYTPHSRQSTAILPVAQGMPIRLLGWPRTRSSFRQCLKEVFDSSCFQNGLSLTILGNEETVDVSQCINEPILYPREDLGRGEGPLQNFDLTLVSCDSQVPAALQGSLTLEIPSRVG
ncbi:hypothetical protein PoB_006957200 [Plakobranchus ocellatus]|uniref:Uncharacterized protein n=1 Tax=Plakobranchus ocellatus TaxID=259542 RepID=A0AAV4DFR8_9GAST|nr:hypothetical protein PoB_006957200 [Plakobranchus ocellatus]